MGTSPACHSRAARWPAWQCRAALRSPINPAPIFCDLLRTLPLAQRGEFAARTLEQWPSCQKYILVDLWAKQVGPDTTWLEGAVTG